MSDTAVSSALEDTVVTSQDAIWCDLNGGAVVLHVGSGIYFGLEGAVSQRIWQFIQTPHKLSQVIDQLTSEFEIDPGACAERATEFIDELAQYRLIVRTRHGDHV